MKSDIAKIIINYFETLMNENHKASIESSFTVINDEVWWFIQTNNGSVLKKQKLSISKDELPDLYLSTYNEFKNITNKARERDILELTNVRNPLKSHLILYIKDKNHKSRVIFELKSNAITREVLDEIKSDWFQIENQKSR